MAFWCVNDNASKGRSWSCRMKAGKSDQTSSSLLTPWTRALLLSGSGMIACYTSGRRIESSSAPFQGLGDRHNIATCWVCSLRESAIASSSCWASEDPAFAMEGLSSTVSQIAHMLRPIRREIKRDVQQDDCTAQTQAPHAFALEANLSMLHQRHASKQAERQVEGWRKEPCALAQIHTAAR